MTGFIWPVSLLLALNSMRVACKAFFEDDSEPVSLLQVSMRNSRVNLGPDIHEGSEEYPWSQRGMDYTTSSFSHYTAPTDFSGGATWKWPNSDDEQVRHSPLIDNDNNIYVTTGWKMRKFDSNGTLMWTLDTQKQVSSPALYKGLIYGVEIVDKGPPLNLFAVNMTTGAVRMNKSYATLTQDGDASSVFVFNDTVIFAIHADKVLQPTHVIFAANASDGSFLWEYEPDDMVWNFAPSAGDGTILFAGSCGRAYRLTFEGKLVWKSGPANSALGTMCGNGGGAVGPNGIFYTEFNQNSAPNFGNTTSHVAAHRISDGHQLWVKTLNFEANSAKPVGNQYPAVGEIQIGGSKKLAVVAAIGWSLALKDSPNNLPEEEWLPNAIVAMDAETGEVLWRYEQPKWAHLVAEGEGVARQTARAAIKKIKPKTDTICWPDPQGIPAISGDGTVYMSSSTSGYLRSIKDKDGNGIMDPSEVSSFYTGNCFLNGPSIGKGMLVAAPCWGPMYVFKEA